MSFSQKDLTIQLAPLCTGTPWLGKVFPLSVCASGPCSELRRHAQTGVFGTPTPRCFEHHNPRVRNTHLTRPNTTKYFSFPMCCAPARVFGTPPPTCSEHLGKLILSLHHKRVPYDRAPVRNSADMCQTGVRNTCVTGGSPTSDNRQRPVLGARMGRI